MSKNAEGYYCHFLPEIFSAVKLKDFKQFSFFDFTGEPILKIKDDHRIIQLLGILEIENKKMNYCGLN